MCVNTKNRIMEEYEDPEPKGKLILKVGRLVIVTQFGPIFHYCVKYFMINRSKLLYHVLLITVVVLTYQRTFRQEKQQQDRTMLKILPRALQISMRKLCSSLKTYSQQL